MTREEELLQKLVDMEVEKERARLTKEKNLSTVKRLLIYIATSYILFKLIIELIIYLDTSARGF